MGLPFISGYYSKDLVVEIAQSTNIRTIIEIIISILFLLFVILSIDRIDWATKTTHCFCLVNTAIIVLYTAVNRIIHSISTGNIIVCCYCFYSYWSVTCALGTRNRQIRKTNNHTCIPATNP